MKLSKTVRRTIFATIIINICSSNLLAEDFRFLQETKNGRTFFDIDSISRSKSKITIKQRTEFIRPQKSILSTPPYEYVATVSTNEYDCNERTMQTIEETRITTAGASKPAEYKMQGSMPLIGPYMEKDLDFVCQHSAAIKP